MTRDFLGKCLVVVIMVSALCVPGGAQVLGDITFSREEGEGGFPAAYFPHWVHRMQYRCYVCHDSIFTMKRGENDVSMAAIAEGKACGTCHNGKIAWAVDANSCNRCHVGE